MSLFKLWVIIGFSGLNVDVNGCIPFILTIQRPQPVNLNEEDKNHIINFLNDPLPQNVQFLYNNCHLELPYFAVQ